MKFSNGQSKLAGEILGNVGVAWIAGGVVSQVFIPYSNPQLFLSSLITGSFIGGGFIYFGLYFVKDID